MPLKRVNQAYVIATSTKVSVDGADVSKFDDAYFKPTEKKVKKKGEKEFFEEEETSAKVHICRTHNFSVIWHQLFLQHLISSLFRSMSAPDATISSLPETD